MTAAPEFNERVPPWAKRIMKSWWRDIVSVAAFADATPDPLQLLGCGHYGCVVATTNDDIVFKVTSDATEAAFVVAAMELKEWPAGMIRYYAILELPEEHHLKRRVFVLWRQKADNVGEIGHVPYGLHGKSVMERYVTRYGRHSVLEFLANLDNFKKTASKMRELVKRSKDPARLFDDMNNEESWAWNMHVNDRDPPPRTPAAKLMALRKLKLEQLSEIMANTHAGSLIGEAFEYYLSEGILLADVHTNNIGEIFPKDYTGWDLAITDPGHMVPLSERWLTLRVPTL